MHEITRKVGEAILLGDDIQLTILNVEGSQARIGVSGIKGKPQLQGQLRAPDSDDASDSYLNAPLIAGNLITGNRSET